ncbi:MAG: substrate-binding domain-containing protein [Candidatus Eremiobacteraeota bacterium]|nr:substrate-binding domain-containing protein [Candidatus Eremiobacteraeota bacterium]
MIFGRRTAAMVFAGLAALLAVPSDSQPLPSPAPTPLQIRIVAMAPFARLVDAIGKDYMRANAGAPPVSVREMTYREAIRSLEGGDSDIAVLDRAPEVAADIARPIAVVPYAIVADPSAGVASLTRAQIGTIFSGSARNWSALGGANAPIVPVLRAPSSGTTKLFAAAFGAPSASDGLLVDNTSGAVLQAVRTTRGSVGYVGLPYARDPAGVRVIAIDGALPSAETIAAGRYPFYTAVHAVTTGLANVTQSRFLSFFETRRDTLHEAGFLTIFEARRR